MFYIIESTQAYIAPPSGALVNILLVTQILIIAYTYENV